MSISFLDKLSATLQGKMNRMGIESMNKQEFIRRMKEVSAAAQQAGAKYNEAVLFAQASLESNWGIPG